MGIPWVHTATYSHTRSGYISQKLEYEGSAYVFESVVAINLKKKKKLLILMSEMSMWVPIEIETNK